MSSTAAGNRRRLTTSKWLKSLRSHLTRTLKIIPQTHNLGILCFEAAGLISNLLHINHSLSTITTSTTTTTTTTTTTSSIHLLGVRKLVSNDTQFLHSLAFAELLHSLHLLSLSASSTISRRSVNPAIRSLDRVFIDFAETGSDPFEWVVMGKGEFEVLGEKLERLVGRTRVLYREMEELERIERKIGEEEEGGKVVWKRDRVRELKEKSLWDKSFDYVTVVLGKLLFSVLARVKIVFGIGGGHGSFAAAATVLPRSLSAASATVYPDGGDQGGGGGNVGGSVSGPLKLKKVGKHLGFFESHTKVLKPPASTVGAAALALHYANLIIVLEKMVKSPQLVGSSARDDLYAMLPRSIRSSLRARLRGVGFSASDPVLAGEWKDALGRILGWLAPLAHNMIKWQSERSFEQHSFSMVPKTNVLLLQTLYFANTEKTEAAITEILVGLNYIWRFEREMMNAKTLLECSNFQGCPKRQKSRQQKIVAS